jgi:hypothetical protein
LVNPFKNAPTDDDFAYAWMVKNLYETGKYVIHEWTVVNIFFQTYYGLIFVKIFGFSYAILRISTLFLVPFGIISFYFLCKEFNLNNRQSGIITIFLFTSPLFLQFSFMSDVQFLCWIIIAIFFYTKSFNRNNIYMIVIASIACSVAILTRQVGIIVIPSLLLWYLSDKKKEHANFYALGLILPISAYIFQTYINFNNLNLISQFRMEQNMNYFSDLKYFLLSSLWRINTVLMYLVLYTLPLALLVIFENISKIKGHISNFRRIHINRLIIIKFI